MGLCNKYISLYWSSSLLQGICHHLI